MSEWYERIAHSFTPPAKGRVIYLNGTSSSGKTTVAKKLRRELLDTGTTYLYLSVDDFGFMLTDTRTVDELLADFDIEAEWPKLYYAFNQVIPAITAGGNNLIVDNVFHSEFWGRQAVKPLKKENVLFIGVYCDDATNDERERVRGDRAVGMAAFQRKQTHKHCAYDLTVDTCVETTDESVQKILAAMRAWDAHAHPFDGIKRTYERMFESEVLTNGKK